MSVHLRKKNEKESVCGSSGYSIEMTDIIEETTCKMCLKSINSKNFRKEDYK